MLYDNLQINDAGHLEFCDHDCTEIAAEYGTPAYIMDQEKILGRIRTYKKALAENYPAGSMPLYAGKALCIKYLYELLAKEGVGIDVVSMGEIYTASEAGFDMKNSYFHGNNKTDEDIAYAMEKGVGYFVCDNLDELDAIDAEAKKRGITQKVILRITPGIDPHTHAKINTGKVDSKFGVAIETGQAEAFVGTSLKKECIDLCGFHCHIGSQIFDIAPFVDAAEVMIGFIADMKDKFGFAAKILNLGGGFGVRYTEEDPEIDYEKNIADVATEIKKQCAMRGIDVPVVLMEPGRSIVADSGITLYKVGGLKEIPGFRNYVSIDGGMPDNARYTLYQSKYTILNASRIGGAPDYNCTIAGRCCESGDIIAEDVSIAKPERGDIIAVLTTGAYNYSMASNYNSLRKPPIIMIGADGVHVAAERETLAHLIAMQK